MSQPATAPAAPVKLNVRAAELTDEQFAQLCWENPELRLELTAQKELVIMSPNWIKNWLAQQQDHVSPSCLG